MTEQEWLVCNDPQIMLEFLRNRSSGRKLRLFAVACCRHLLLSVRVDPKDLHAVDVAERYADGESSSAELEAAGTYIAGPPSARRTAAFACRDAASTDSGFLLADCSAGNAAWAAGEYAASQAGTNPDDPVFAAARAAEEATQAALLREIFGPLPFRDGQFLPSSVLIWNDGCVVKLATSIYQERSFDRLPILADALEEAGCDNAEIVNHCRQPGEHVRGCWVVDRLLGKE